MIAEQLPPEQLPHWVPKTAVDKGLPDWMKDMRVDSMRRLLCTEATVGKEPCRSPAVKGARFCRMHGGTSPRIKRKAQLRLQELIDPAIATLAREMVQADRSADRQRAANSLLDRAGVPRVVKEQDISTSRDILLQRLSSLRTQNLQAAALTGDAGGSGALDDDLDEDDDKYEEQ